MLKSTKFLEALQIQLFPSLVRFLKSLFPHAGELVLWLKREVEDFFQVRKLQFPLEDAEKEEPKFLSDDIYEAIKIISFNANSDECYNPFK